MHEQFKTIHQEIVKLFRDLTSSVKAFNNSHFKIYSKVDRPHLKNAHERKFFTAPKKIVNKSKFIK